MATRSSSGVRGPTIDSFGERSISGLRGSGAGRVATLAIEMNKQANIKDEKNP